jgi:hypothetical protein
MCLMHVQLPERNMHANRKKKRKSGTAPYPRGASASAPPKGEKEGGQKEAQRDLCASFIKMTPCACADV